ncbi:DoxX family protein [Mycobacterium sp. MBM]|nr:DoxX family protein [Mycobacterium sp. MBM]
MSTSTAAVETRLSSNTPVVLGVFRILVGLMFAMHGTAKLFGFPSGSAAAFGAWPSWWAGILEIGLGLLVAVGLFTRVAAFIASGMMAVAYFWMHFPAAFWPIDNGGETAALYSFIFALLVFIGPGGLAVRLRRLS